MDNKDINGVTPNVGGVEPVRPNTDIDTTTKFDHHIEDAFVDDEPAGDDKVIEVAGPTVAPPHANFNGELKVDEDDGRILKPFVEELEIEEKPAPQPTTPNTPAVQPDVIVDNNGAKKEVLENKKMEEVKIDYKPPGKIKTFFMFLLFACVLGVIIFMPEINQYIEKLQETPTDTETDAEILNGTLSCSLETSDDKYDLIYATDFYFSRKQLTSLSYTVTTKGDKTLDFDALTTMYNNCKSLSTELTTTKAGVDVSCDTFEGTVTIGQEIDYSLFDEKTAKDLFKKYSIDLPDFEADENIDDIEKSLKSSNYICEKVSSDKSE